MIPVNEHGGNGDGKSVETKVSSRVDLDALLDPSGMLKKGFVLPGMDGLPYRGDAIPDLKEGDEDTRRPKIACQVFVDILDLSMDTELDYYRKVMQLVANGYANISVEERLPDPEKKNWRVFLRWMLNYVYMSEAPTNG